ncbi:MAG: SDR family oxidoreductase [Oxalobacter sp.]|nr:SDR family oxidoreductase [Oxalobacter sp.]
MRAYDLLLFGATRNTGLHIARLATQCGKQVAAMVRPRSDAAPLEMLDVHIIEGDAFLEEDCRRAVEIACPRHVISLMGGKNAEGRRVCAEGNINVIRALAHSSRLERMVLVTSMGCGEQYEGVSSNVKQFLGEALRAKTEAENLLKKSGLPWTIVRPGGLNNEPGTGDFCFLDAPDRRREGYLAREDVAQATLHLLEDPDWLYRAVTIQRDVTGGNGA